MAWTNPYGINDFADKVFDVSIESLRHKPWFWWFFLLFIDDPCTPDTPRQFMLAWTKKDAKEIYCNGREFSFEKRVSEGRDGVVIGWYFDGSRMHHNLLLDKCCLDITDASLSTSSPATNFEVSPGKSRIDVGDRFMFDIIPDSDHGFLEPAYYKDNIIGELGYSMLSFNRRAVAGTIDGEKVTGSAYFQRVFVNAPVVPWYWGVFHFKNGGALTYYMPYILGKSLRREVRFFDGVEMRVYESVSITRVPGKLPSFKVRAGNGREEIAFNVEPYSHSLWTLESRPLGLFKSRLHYNEYPAMIKGLTVARDGSEIVTQEVLGEAVGNAEHTTGILF
ncbi:hypothetical protein ACFLRF_01995 [Candidatus Altiarchaeota archaeon]